MYAPALRHGVVYGVIQNQRKCGESLREHGGSDSNRRIRVSFYGDMKCKEDINRNEDYKPSEYNEHNILAWNLI